MEKESPIDAYVREVETFLEEMPRRDRNEALRELKSLLHADARRTSEEAAVSLLCSPAEYAAHIREAFQGEEEDLPTPQGSVLGMPYDFRGASISRVSERIWNPADTRVFVPRLFGVGWTINLGAVAVKLGLVRPDDISEVAFERIPKSVIFTALAIPALFAVGELLLVAYVWRDMPSAIPVHWGIGGAPDNWASPAVAFGPVLFLTVAPVAVAFLRALRKGSTQRVRLLTAAATGCLSVLGIGVSAMMIIDADGGASGQVIWAVLAAALCTGFVLLYAPLRLGLRAEWNDAAVESRPREKKRG